MFTRRLELLQHDFQSNVSSERVQASLEPNLALGQQAHIGQITLRVSDINRSLQFYQSTLGMKLLSIDLVTVFDAILTGRQTREKLQCLYENLMWNNFRKTAVLKKISIVN